MKRPNILYLHSHDTGRYIQPYGHSVATPNVQRLAKQGVLFRKAFCATPVCSPSRASLLTGQYPQSHGLMGLSVPIFQFSLPHTERLLSNVLKQHDYYTMLAGIQHVVLPHELDRLGYDQIFPCERVAKEQRDLSIAQAAIDFLNDPPQQPFFLDVGFYDTHVTLPEPGPEDDPRYCLPPAGLPDTPETRKDMAAFRAAARRLDKHMGMVLEALDTTGLRENTLVICTTDHGIPFPRMKGTLYDGGLEVMLIMRGPDQFAGGQVIDSLVSHIDLLPTICDYLAIPRPDWLQGVSLLPLVEGKQSRVRQEIFATSSYQNAYEPQRCIRTERWKYYRHCGENRYRVRANCDPVTSRYVLIEHGWNDQLQQHEMLYDLIFDPHEKNNLADQIEYQHILRELRQRLEQWMCDTNDPLLQGPVPKPVNSHLLDPNRDL